ncbi:HlyC/CorC family transporter [Candidatus Parcubacteria bacterium]|jgi:putative hemolysin|nr:HlyC/CorC family transporter [Candidatus Parcubacteria bacterium]MBT7228157.1 HlyC/CorC family transporter [Candidatus Parcubacteria bacterium]
MMYLVLLILIALSAWFSGMEIAMFSMSSAQVKSMAMAKKSNAELLQKLLIKKQRLLVVILLGNNLVNIGAASLATVMATQKFGSAGAGIATGAMTLLILVFGEMYPKAYFEINAERLARLFSPMVYFLQIILFPIVYILEKLLIWLTRGKNSQGVSETEFKALSRLAVEEGVLEFEEHEMIMNILEFDDKEIKEIMIPRYKMVVLNDDAEVDQVSYFMAQEGFSRYPVYHNQKDNIVGYVHVLDIMEVLNSDNREDSLEKHVHPILKIKEDDKINNVFNKMRRKRTHMAIVIRNDELVGLVTMEDLLEEIVGDIEDEND